MKAQPTRIAGPALRVRIRVRARARVHVRARVVLGGCANDRSANASHPQLELDA